MTREVMLIVAACVFAGVASSEDARTRGPPPSPPPPTHESMPLRPSAWDRIQEPMDRSSGRITDEPTHELDQIRRDTRLREFERFQIERDRTLRLEDRARREQQIFESDRQRREAMDRREYELSLESLSPMNLAAAMDQQALMNAQARRNAELLAADEHRVQTLEKYPADRERIEQIYGQKVSQIRQRYEAERARILGFDPPAATTTPSTSASPAP